MLHTRQFVSDVCTILLSPGANYFSLQCTSSTQAQTTVLPTKNTHGLETYAYTKSIFIGGPDSGSDSVLGDDSENRLTPARP
jgi:hypothetical protein